MKYNNIAGQSTNRIEAISDGVFAVAMTLLVLDIKAPTSEIINSEKELIQMFSLLAPKFLVYFLSFMTAGIFWTGQSTQFKYIVKSDRNLYWTTLLFLLFVSLLPFSTSFLSENVSFKFAIAVYWFNILMLGVTLYLNWHYAKKNNFLNLESQEAKYIHKAISYRIIIAQTLYGLAALLCFIHTYLSIIAIILIQINYAFGITSNKKNKS